MPDDPRQRAQAFVEQLMSARRPSRSVVERAVGQAALLRTRSPELSMRIDEILVARLFEMKASIRDASEAQTELRSMLEQLGTTPWQSALLERLVETSEGTRAVVRVGELRRAVAFGPGVEPSQLRRGGAVFLSGDGACLVGADPDAAPDGSELVHFERLTPDGRLQLQVRGERFLADAAEDLSVEGLEPGDPVLWSRRVGMVFERFESQDGREYWIEEVEDVDPQGVGGQRDTLDRLCATLYGQLVDPKAARLYGVDGNRAVLMVGPPGCGKTLMARAAAAALRRASGRRCVFAAVKPGQWSNSYVGVTEENIRSCFRSLRRAAADGHAVLFLDEVESVARVRGAPGSRHADAFLGALLAELDGFEGRGNVAVVAATNRKELLDPAFASRFCDVELRVGRPDARAAREIFGIHLPEELPYRPNGPLASATREEAIESAVSALYAPNAAGELAELELRGGERRRIAVRELVSGRLIERIAMQARSRAYQRHVGGGVAGVGVDDVQAAVCDAIERLGTTLSPGNAHAHLEDLPREADVVRVSSLRPRVTRAHRTLRTA